MGYEKSQLFQLSQMPQNLDMQACIENCQDCASICTQTFKYCLGKGGPHGDKEHLILLQVCAQICQTSAFTMLLGSPEHHVTCGASAKICKDCAESCEKFPNDEVMKACADISRKCADSCFKMVIPSGDKTERRESIISKSA